MISFPCPCGKHRFNLPDDEAGSLVQCPKCSRLNDVPTLNELAAMDIDGTLKVADDRPQSDPRLLAEQLRTFGRKRTDDSGDEIDLRQTFDDLRAMGTTEVPLDLKDEVFPGAPKYDPVTGELIQPLDVKPRQAKPVVPIPAPADRSAAYDAKVRAQGGLTYAKRPGATSAGEVNISLVSLPIRLLEPINFMVMLFVGVVAFVGSIAGIFPLMGGFFLLYAVPVIISAILLAHYACCIEELGPGGQEELPRPLRSFELSSDLWWPFIHMFVSIAVCFGPAWAFFNNTDKFPPVAQFVGTGVLFVAGVLLFPAVALILCASGHFGNLRPDRVLNTIATLGWAYLPTTFIVISAVIANVATTGFIIAFLGASLMPGGGGGKSYPLIAGLGGGAIFACAASVYLSHLACWWLGVLYRRHEEHMPWEFQELERLRAEHKRLKVLAEIEKSRRR